MRKRYFKPRKRIIRKRNCTVIIIRKRKGRSRRRF